MRTNVIAKLELEGLHNWPDAKKVFPEVGFLSDIHRHKWYITAKKKVNHDDRDIEFIMFKRDILEYLRSKYYKEDYLLDEFNCLFYNPGDHIDLSRKITNLLEDKKLYKKLSNNSEKTSYDFDWHRLIDNSNLQSVLKDSNNLTTA